MSSMRGGDSGLRGDPRLLDELLDGLGVPSDEGTKRFGGTAGHPTALFPLPESDGADAVMSRDVYYVIDTHAIGSTMRSISGSTEAKVAGVRVPRTPLETRSSRGGDVGDLESRTVPRNARGVRAFRVPALLPRDVSTVLLLRDTTPDMAFQLKITLKHIKPPIWRRLLVSEELTLSQLHRAVQESMGWMDYHLHEFNIAGRRFGLPSPDDDLWDGPAQDERKIRLRQFATPRLRFRYEYDFGDGWEHEILVEKELEERSGVAVVCLAGKRACPPEDCGGPWGYMELLEILAEPTHEEYEERLTWVGGDFDPESFELALVNNRLAEHGPKVAKTVKRKNLRP